MGVLVSIRHRSGVSRDSHEALTHFVLRSALWNVRVSSLSSHPAGPQYDRPPSIPPITDPDAVPYTKGRPLVPSTPSPRSKRCVHVAPGKHGDEKSQLYCAWHTEPPGSQVYAGLHPALAATAEAASASARRASLERIANVSRPARIRVAKLAGEAR
jgi:hypothetical protein